MLSACASEYSEARARARVYAFLAELFGSKPTEAAVGALRLIAEELGIECPDELSIAELEREYMELFVIPNPRYVAPYESVFLDEWPLPDVLPRGSNPSETGGKIKGLLMGESTLKVRACYARAGVSPERELPDHIANELRFLAYLCEREAESPAVYGPLRRQFLDEHLLRWIGELRSRIESRDRLGFYRAAIDVTAALLEGN